MIFSATARFRPMLAFSATITPYFHCIGEFRLHPRPQPRRLPLRTISSSSSPAPPITVDAAAASDSTAPSGTRQRWKPTCLYHSQGKCAMVNEPEHLEKFNHDLSLDLQVDDVSLLIPCSPNLDRLLVLDLEGKVEILEFPVVMIDANTMSFVDSFHRFVRPVRMAEKRINEYIDGKYGKLGVDRVWHDTAIPFKEVIQEFETWLASHNLWRQEHGGKLHRAAFVTCGNWDLKTKIPQQCSDSRIKLPPYFMEWINLKDIFLNFYKIRATGMVPMMRELGISLLGSHHLGMDDAKNITRVLQRMIADGSQLQITARRRSSGSVEFLLENRIR